VVVFDLDDTLYHERDFVRSGFRAVSQHVAHHCQTQVFTALETLFENGHTDPIGQVFDETRLPISKQDLLEIYRNHVPDIKLAAGVRRLLDGLHHAGHPLGLLTDGRSITQRNKIRSLGLDRWFEEIVISDEFGSSKPSVANYRYFERRYPGRCYAYVGDNLAKDFVAPNALGWLTLCVKDRGQHIHPQVFQNAPEGSLPQLWLDSVA
jgi:putative hydrolase of the HAD superfamily